MSLSRKDYEAIAEILMHSNKFETPHYFIANELSTYFASENGRFDKARFMKACGVE